MDIYDIENIGMDIPEEIKYRTNRTVVYRMRYTNPFSLWGAVSVCFALGVGGGTVYWSELGASQAVGMIAFGIVAPILILYFGRSDRGRYEIGPESITVVPDIGPSRTLNWSDVTKFETRYLGWNYQQEIRLVGKDKFTICFYDSVPRIQELLHLIQYHLRVHGKSEIVDQFIRQ